MEGKRNCRGNGGTAAEAAAAAAVGGALAAGAVQRLTRTQAQQVRQEGERPAGESRAWERAEDMPMCRHVNPINTSAGCCTVERQLWELNQVLDYQNRILVQLLQAVREGSEGT